MSDWRQDIYDKMLELENTMHTSGIVDPNMRRLYRLKVEDILSSKIKERTITQESDVYDEVRLAYDESFDGKYSVADTGEHNKYNLLYRKEPFEKYQIPHERVGRGAHFLANNYKHKNLVLGVYPGKREDFNKITTFLTEDAIKKMNLANLTRKSPIGGDVNPDITSTKLDEDLTRGFNIPQETTQNLGDNANDNLTISLNQQSVTEQQILAQQTLDDIMAGNAKNMYTALIPRAKNQPGYLIAVFNKPRGGSPGKHQIIGVMQNPGGGNHIISEEELIGASASNQILEYLASWWFDYDHKNVEKLYNHGRDPNNRVEGPGRAVPGFDWFGIEGYGDGMLSSARRAYKFATSEGKIGDLEFKHALEPLYAMLSTRAKELGVEYLDREQSQDVLRKFSDRFNRSFSKTFEHEPLSFFKGIARWVENFDEYDLNLREGNRNIKAMEQMNKDLSPFIGN